MIRPTFEEVCAEAGRLFAVARAERDALSPREAAEAAWYPGHSLGTVEAIEALIIKQRCEAEEAWAAGTHPLQLREQRRATGPASQGFTEPE